LKGADGVIFVADSHPLRMEANAESLESLRRNLQDYGLSIPPLPAVIQYNKRDLPNALPLPDVRRSLGNPELPEFEASATRGYGVFEPLKELARQVLQTLRH
jgi:signal recognition particle receptor subunit beta